MVTSRTAALAALFMLLPATSAHAADRCTKGTEFDPPMCPLSLPPIARIVIDENAARLPNSDDPSIDCTRFVVDERLIKRYLTRARRVVGGPVVEHYSLLWSPCYAAGTLQFRDGRSARWEVSQFRVGWLFLDGQQDGLTLYCPRCKDSPFAW